MKPEVLKEEYDEFERQKVRGATPEQQAKVLAFAQDLRILRDMTRRARLVGALPDGHSALMLVAGRLRHIASTR